ncbi:hypothetical protein I6N95_14535 [Vagococcus sp. BWB3-3]|uniref:HTH cro/C1-type domain-containing protein n=1 Tax=Vagococcus allomyrinae TaxID=2794353 RepID=A0A940PG38_9ENTE|nr:Rgg/GadR/MutR family transcriptional regulator [Vagococcus allomyrinae]MBP1042233.1 hypothetical protein [Vagococcus allomyrinae]
MMYGEEFKKIRIEKQLTISETASGIMSISLLSKFERGLCEITVSKFVKILDRVNVTLSEFELIVSNFQKSRMMQLLDELRESYLKKEYTKIEAIMANESALWKDTRHVRHRYNYIMFSIVYDELRDENTTSEEDIEFLTDYLFSIEDWTQYELILYGNSVAGIKFDAMMLLSNELIHKTRYFQNNSAHRKMIAQILLNSAIVCLMKDELEISLKFQTDVSKLLTSEHYLHERNVLNYLNGIYLYKKGEIIEGQQKVDAALSIFRKLDSDHLATNFSEFFEDMKKSKT